MTLSVTHLSVGQSGSLLERTGGVLELLELLQLEQASGALGSAGLLGQIIALEQLLVLSLEQRITGRGLGEDEEHHFSYFVGAGAAGGGRGVWGLIDQLINQSINQAGD